MAVFSTLFNMTNSFQVVFVSNTALALAVLVIAWLTIE